MATTVTITRSVVVNAAFLQEIKEDNVRLQKLLKLIRRMFDRAQPSARQCPRAVRLLTELRDQLARHFQLEEAFGYLEQAVCEEPTLADGAEKLRAQHRVIHDNIVSLVDDCQSTMDGTSESQWFVFYLASRRFRRFDAMFVEHEAAENLLIYQANCIDTGVGD